MSTTATPTTGPTSNKPDPGSLSEALASERVPNLFSNLWILFYRHGMNAALSKGFYYEGTLLQAQLRAQEHCKIMGYRYHFIRPMVVNINNEEAYVLTGKKREEEVMP